jgi:ribonuclease P/MRP protein subunit POP5
MVIIRIAREHFRLLWAAITYVVMIGGQYGMMRVLHVGGSMRACQKNALQFGLGELQIEIAATSV